MRKKPTLHPAMDLQDFKSYYWMKADLAKFARRLELPTDGDKPALSARILRRLRGMPDTLVPKLAEGRRDSERALRRSTPVVHFKSDDKTREFFKSQIGPEFHFTYHVNQFRLAHRNLTYGDLIDEWLAERDRRQRGDYKAPIAQHGKYNRFIRDFFADARNKGKSMQHAAAAWNAIKNKRGMLS